MIEDFFNLPLLSMTPVVHLELRISPRIFEKIRNGPNGTLRSLGETDSWKKNQKSKISWHYPFKSVSRKSFIVSFFSDCLSANFENCIDFPDVRRAFNQESFQSFSSEEVLREFDATLAWWWWGGRSSSCSNSWPSGELRSILGMSNSCSCCVLSFCSCFSSPLSHTGDSL